MTATIDGLVDWARERGLACRPLNFGHGMLVSETVSVGFREASPFVVVDWGDGCQADFARGLPLGLLTYFIAGLLPAAAESVTFDLSDPDARHALVTALEDYAAKERDMAAGEGGHESRERWADLADRMRAQAEAAG